MRKLLFIAMLTISCGRIDREINQFTPQPEDPREGKSVDPSVLPFYQFFENLYSIKVGDIPVTIRTITELSQSALTDSEYEVFIFDIDDQQEHPVGFCKSWVWSNGSQRVNYREIVIDTDFWNQAGDNQREQLVLHELGHCRFSREHITTLHNTEDYKDVPNSIMYPRVFGHEPFYEALKPFYYDELQQIRI